ncbi:MAG: crosslink repair DNA glycosylase YcaQ family protein [Acidimicrobiales bacterium]
MTVRPDALSADQARRIALGAQGFADARPPGRVDRRHGRRVLDRIGLLQIDSVNVVVRSQELPLFARLGHHRRDLVPQMTAAGDVFEYWAHEASHLPPAFQPLLRWRMDAARDGLGTWAGVARIAQDRPELVASVFREVAERGPLTAGMLQDPGGGRGKEMWDRTPGKWALEYLFWSGQITARRGPNFERRYDLLERALPTEVLDAPTPPPGEAKKELLLVGARAHGVGTVRDLADYFRLNIPESRSLVAELVAEGRLEQVAVEGWREPAYSIRPADPGGSGAGRCCRRSIRSCEERARTERIWGFRYRLEIYTPSHQRVHGYYVLPFLLDGRLVARVDLKADRAAGRLLVRSAWGEDGIDVGHVARGS